MRRVTQGRLHLSNPAVGVILIVLVIFGLYLAFTKSVPFVPKGYEIQGVFRNAQTLTTNSPVRVAGVNVGKVSEVEPLPGKRAALVTMTVTDAGRPVHTDARMQLRPRLFLEGNYFVELHPGSPSTPELEDGAQIPIQQTSNSVQLDQVLTTLQADVRGNTQLLLRELGDAFAKHGGAEGFRTLYRTGGPAFRYTSLVNEAALGTQPHDLSGVVRNFDIVARALDRHQAQLQDLVTNFRIVTGSFAAENEALAAAVHELPQVLETARPTFASLNAAFPFVRAFAREALPGVRSTPPALDASLPFIHQLSELVSEDELRGLVSDLRPTVPQLALLTRRQVPFMEQARALSSCFTHVIIPWSNDEVVGSEVGHSLGKIYEETGYALVGQNGESRSGDANGQYIRTMAGGGLNTVELASPDGPEVGVTTFPIIGTQPAKVDLPKTKFRPDVPCETQEAPDLGATVGPAPPQRQIRGGGQTVLTAPALKHTALADATRKLIPFYTDQFRLQQAVADGRRARAADLLGGILDKLGSLRRNGIFEDYSRALRLLGQGKLGG